MVCENGVNGTTLMENSRACPGLSRRHVRFSIVAGNVRDRRECPQTANGPSRCSPALLEAEIHQAHTSLQGRMSIPVSISWRLDHPAADSSGLEFRGAEMRESSNESLAVGPLVGFLHSCAHGIRVKLTLYEMQ
ncbi:MAG: hypothetical protein JWL65_6307 [Gammaproteobacteria bacterium]|nr:hypothetical protein [Gammaproteobacteria bacterium]